jgi:superoxide reductase
MPISLRRVLNIHAAVVDEGNGELVCCGDPMKRITENTVDATEEKHVPVIEMVDGG